MKQKDKPLATGLLQKLTLQPLSKLDHEVCKQWVAASKYPKPSDWNSQPTYHQGVTSGHAFICVSAVFVYSMSETVFVSPLWDSDRSAKSISRICSKQIWSWSTAPSRMKILSTECVVTSHSLWRRMALSKRFLALASFVRWKKHEQEAKRDEIESQTSRSKTVHHSHDIWCICRSNVTKDSPWRSATHAWLAKPLVSETLLGMPTFKELTSLYCKILQVCFIASVSAMRFVRIVAYHSEKMLGQWFQVSSLILWSFLEGQKWVLDTHKSKAMGTFLQPFFKNSFRAAGLATSWSSHCNKGEQLNFSKAPWGPLLHVSKCCASLEMWSFPCFKVLPF